jgi:hypothetical protein
MLAASLRVMTVTVTFCTAEDSNRLSSPRAAGYQRRPVGPPN